MEVTCGDCWFGGKRHQQKAASVDEIQRVLYNNQFGLNALFIIEAILFLLWLLFSMVPGFAIYTVDPSILVSSGWGHAVTHLGWWLMIELVVLLLAFKVTTFNVGAAGAKLEFVVEPARNWIQFYGACLCISMLADITHIVLIGLEIGQQESVFTVNYFWMIIVFLTIRIVNFIIVKTWILVRLYVYDANLKGTLQYHPSVFSIQTIPSQKNFVELLKDHQVGLNVLFIVEALLLLLWISFSMVRGFAIYAVDPSFVGTPSGWSHAVYHLGWWIAIEVLVLLLAVRVLGFESASSGLESQKIWLQRYGVILCLSMLADITHIVLIGLEINQNESIFAINYFWLLIIFLIVRIVNVAIVKPWILGRLYLYDGILSSSSGKLTSALKTPLMEKIKGGSK